LPAFACMTHLEVKWTSTASIPSLPQHKEASRKSKQTTAILAIVCTLWPLQHPLSACSHLLGHLVCHLVVMHVFQCCHAVADAAADVCRKRPCGQYGAAAAHRVCQGRLRSQWQRRIQVWKGVWSLTLQHSLLRTSDDLTFIDVYMYACTQVQGYPQVLSVQELQRSVGRHSHSTFRAGASSRCRDGQHPVRRAQHNQTLLALANSPRSCPVPFRAVSRAARRLHASC
jgi:hypothetical protein